MVKPEVFKFVRVEQGAELPAYAWPGGYPIIYLFEDMETCCPKCANDKDVREQNDAQWNVVSAQIHYEGTPEQCANCNAEIESAYGDADSVEV